MDGIHDMGGMHGFGPVRAERDEPVFHAEWESRVLALTLAAGAHGRWTIDQSRSYRESLPPATYLTSSYYEIWLAALERLVDDSRLLTDPPEDRAPGPGRMREILDRGGDFGRAPAGEARFAVGARVRARNDHPAGHTRLPRYVRGACGTVVAVRGTHVFPDRSGVPVGERVDPRPEWLYTVEFAGPDLWGADADPSTSVSVEAWEPYLETAS